MDNIGIRIDEFIDELNVTQKDFAQEIGVSEQAVSNWKNQGSSPGLDTILKIIRAYHNINVRWLLLGHGDKLSRYVDIEKKFEELQKENLKFREIIGREGEIQVGLLNRIDELQQKLIECYEK